MLKRINWVGLGIAFLSLALSALSQNAQDKHTREIVRDEISKTK